MSFVHSITMSMPEIETTDFFYDSEDNNINNRIRIYIFLYINVSFNEKLTLVHCLTLHTNNIMEMHSIIVLCKLDLSQYTNFHLAQERIISS